jgi:hypothetical protein
VDRRRQLSLIFERHATPDARASVGRELERAASEPFDSERLATTFTGLDRRAGREAIVWTAEDQAALGPAAIATTGELARVLLLAAAEERAPAGAYGPVLRRAYDDGDNRERIAVLRALPFLARPAEHLELAIESTRTHVIPIFEALACENPFPAAHFPDLNFNQMALKAAFVGLALARIAGLAKRRTPELARMARDYAAERRAAGRPVPSDLVLLEEPS